MVVAARFQRADPPVFLLTGTLKTCRHSLFRRPLMEVKLGKGVKARFGCRSWVCVTADDKREEMGSWGLVMQEARW